MRPASIHASCVLVGEGGILIRGASGTGKSRLAMALIDTASRDGCFARLVGDDRIDIVPRGGRLIARGNRDIAGHIEAHGIGILPEAFEPAAVLRLVVDLIEGPGPRFPEPDQSIVELHGVALPHVTSRIRANFETVVLRKYRVLNDTLMME